MLLRRILFSWLLFFSIVPSGLTLLPQTAEAAAFGLVPCGLREDDQSTTQWREDAPCTLCHLLLGMQRLVTFMRNIMTAIAVAVIVAMSIMYIVSAGNEGMMSTAKKGIIASLIGFAVILLAWIIVNFIFTLPIFASNGLVRTSGWDTFTCNTTSQVNTGNTTAARSGAGISNTSGNSGSTGPGRAENPGPGTGSSTGGGSSSGGGNNTTCNQNNVCDGGETCTTCAADCGACTPPNGFGCGQKHYECVNGDVETPFDQGGQWFWTCRGNKAPHLGESKTCIEKKPICGDGLVNQASEQCDAGASNGDNCPATCNMTCQSNSCGPAPTGGAACGSVVVNNNAAFCAEGIWIGGDPPTSPSCTFTASEIVCRWRCQSADGQTTVSCAGSAPRPSVGNSCEYAGGVVSWGDGCGAETPAVTMYDGEFRSFSSTSGHTGSITYACNNGSLTQTDAICN